MPHVTFVEDPYATAGSIAPDGRTLVARVYLDVVNANNMPVEDTKRLLVAAKAAERTGLTVALGGRAVQLAEATQSGSEMVGLLVAAVAVVLMILVLDLDAIASIGSAVALAVFSLISIGHVIIRSQTGARLSLLIAGLVTSVTALLTFVFTTVIQEPATIVTLVLIFVASVIFDIVWSRPVASRTTSAG